VWHCDSLGDYSHFSQNVRQDTSTFLRGIQLSNRQGEAIFDTIYPGWYPGRAIHVHVKVHVGGSITNSSGTYMGGHVSHIGQLYFNETLTDQISQLAPYNTRRGERLRLTNDFTYTRLNGSAAMVNVQLKNQANNLSGGIIGHVTLGVDSKQTVQAEMDFGMRPPRPGQRPPPRPTRP
ncbi:unnamed protein product, partial [Didymodactylos carnosus]